MISKDDLKAAWNIYVFMTIIGLVAIFAYKAGSDRRRPCPSCGDIEHINNITDKATQ